MTIAIGAGLALMALTLPLMLREESAGVPLTSYPTGRTQVAYAGNEVTATGERVAVFTFSNGEPFQVKVRCRSSARMGPSADWKEVALQGTNEFRVPNRQAALVRFSPPVKEGEWRIIFNAEHHATGFAMARERIQRFWTKRHETGGLVGAWATPAMEGVMPASVPKSGTDELPKVSSE